MRTALTAFLVGLLWLFGSAKSTAQSYTELTFGAGFPAGSFHEFVPTTGWWNTQFQARTSINSRYEVGGAIGWNYFEHNFGQRTISGEGYALTANMTSYTNILSFMLVNQYNLIEKGEVIPFARMGLGLAHQNQDLEAGIYMVEERAWQFILNPELGLRIELGPNLGAVISGAYTFMPESGGVLPTSFWSLKFGLSWLHF